MITKTFATISGVEVLAIMGGWRERVAATFDGLATRYDTRPGGFFVPTSAELIELAGLSQGQRVLDVGCGAGACLLGAAPAVAPGGRVTGFDVAPGMAARTASSAAALGLRNVAVLVGDASAPPFAPGSFDVVLASNVMFLLTSPADAARRYLHLLPAGGVFAFSWNVAEDPAWVPVLAAVDGYAAGGGFSTFLHRPPFNSAAAMEALLRECGYVDVVTRQSVAEIRYPDPEAWWRVSWEQAPALFWSSIPAASLRAAEKSALGILEGMREADGSVVRHLNFCFIRAVRP
jgi:SAM-dependent methyltransferase